MSSAALPDSLAKIVQRFQKHTDPKRRYEQLIWYANRLAPFPESEKVPENRVAGCVSQVHIISSLQEGKVFFQGDSDSQLVKGLVALLVEGLNGLTPEEILAISADFIQDTGLNVSLTPSRTNGFYNMFKFMQQRATHYKTAQGASQN